MKRCYGVAIGDELDNIRYIQSHLQSEKIMLKNLYNTKQINLSVYEWALKTINQFEIETWYS
jgi:hypothetical protein